MKKIDAIAAEITTATRSVAGIEEYGRLLVSVHPEFAAHRRNGISYEEIGQSHLEEQIRLYLAYTLDRATWQQLVTRTEQFAVQDPNALAPMFSPWGYLHSDLVENIGEGFGWTAGSHSMGLDDTTFVQRLGAIVSTFAALTPSQVRQLEQGLNLEEGVAVPRSGGCYVATAVYGSYDAPEVRVLRRWRDSSLQMSAVGRLFVRFYYLTSPCLVNAVGNRPWFVVPSRAMLDRLVRILEHSGYADKTGTSFRS